MEGTLERKQKLQLGGKKAASRSWNSYHTVLYRHTLCFYQDRKETLRSSACCPPLNLNLAECLWAPEYTKKPNCFCLRLRDGSEYLFSASTRFIMNTWVSKIQASTGASQPLLSTLTVDDNIPISLSPPPCSGCHGLSKCYCTFQHDVTSTFPRRKPPNTFEDMFAVSREIQCFPQSHLKCLEEESTLSSTFGHSCSADCSSTCKQMLTHSFQGPSRENTSVSHWSPPHSNQDKLSSKPRSHSFTSATYQKIKPTQQTCRGPEKTSNYSVTLVLGDKLLDGKPYGTPSVTVAGWQKDACSSTTYNVLNPPRRKSVLMKIFGKKDL
ncbi:uncharacterized protein LOC144205678 [Stigmatopora nigra]